MIKRNGVMLVLFMFGIAHASDQTALPQNSTGEPLDIIKSKLLEVFKDLNDPIVEGDFSNAENGFNKGAYFSPCGLVYVRLAKHNIKQGKYRDSDTPCPHRQWDIYCHYAYYTDGKINKNEGKRRLMTSNTEQGTNLNEYGGNGKSGIG